MNKPPNHDQDLGGLALRAAYEIESIAAVLQVHFQQTNGSDQFVLGLAIRLEVLAGVVMNTTIGEGQSCNFDEERAALIGPAAVRLAAATD